MRKSHLKLGASLACLFVASFNHAAAQQRVALADSSSATASKGGVEEIIVSAQRRNESAQEVPMTIQAFSGATLEQQNITTLEDLIKYTPNVSFANNGPGQGNIYMRGLSTGFAGNQSSATIGNFPNVALYLDDQSMQFPARNVDVYMVDMERVEVLEGPQGTLFGGGAEAGALRYITNKPKLNVFEGRAEGSYGFTQGGDSNTALNAMINIPVIKDRLAVRAVIYNDRQGGYIDNVPSTFTRSNNDPGNYYLNIKPNAAGVCPNGKGTTSGFCTLGTTQQINNQQLAQSAQNPTTYTGGRLAIAGNINDDWDFLITESLSKLDAEGMSVEFPVGSDFQTLKPLQVTSFTPSYDHDNYNNTAWTVNGQIGDFKAVYTGAYLNRHIEQQMDYTNYSRTAYGIYYECTGGATGWGSAAPKCYSAQGYWHDKVRNTHHSEELRVSTPDKWRIRGIVGGFWEQFRIYDTMNFNYKTIPSCTPDNLKAALAGGDVCVANVRTAPGSTANDPGIRPDNTGFGEDTQRGYDQTALFGSIDYDIIPEVLTVTTGARYYRYSEFETGSQYATNGSCLNVPNGACTGGMVNIDSHGDRKVYAGTKSRANITWHVTPDTMAYFTFSQGFRPGGFNRAVSNVAKDASGKPQFTRPNGYAPDSLNNFEIGSKSEFFQHRLQLNVSAYYMQWKNVQFGFYNPTELGNTTFGTNGPDYEVKGLEAQFIGKLTDDITLQGSGSYNDSTQATSPCLVGNIAGSPTNGQCITSVRPNGSAVAVPFVNPFGNLGSTPAFSPKYMGDMRVRYDWRYNDYKFFATVGGNYVASMYNQPGTYPSGEGVVVPNTTQLRYLQPGYGTLNANINLLKDNWGVSIYGSNLTNSHASVFTSSAQFIKSEVPIRPCVVGVKMNASF